MDAKKTQARVYEHVKNSKERLLANWQSEQQGLQNRRFGSATAPPSTGTSMAAIKTRREGEEADVGGSHCAESNSPPTASVAYDAGTFELHNDGELFPKKKISGRHNINCGYSLRDITNYVTVVAPLVTPSAENASGHLPCHSCADYVLTLYVATQSRSNPKFSFASHSKCTSAKLQLA